MTEGATEKTELISQAEFARRRGVSRATVYEYKAKGYLVMTDDGKVDVAASQARLVEHLDASRGGKRAAKKPAAGSSNSKFMQAKTEEMQARASRQQLELLEKAGTLVDREKVEKAAFTLARAAQEGLISIPDRLSSLLAAEDDAAVIHKMISDEVRSVANTLAKNAEAIFE